MSTGGMAPKNRVPPGEVGRQTLDDAPNTATGEPHPAEPCNYERSLEVRNVSYIPFSLYIVSNLEFSENPETCTTTD